MNKGDKVWFFDGSSKPDWDVYEGRHNDGMFLNFLILQERGIKHRNFVYPDTQRGMQECSTAVAEHILMLHEWEADPAKFGGSDCEL